MSDKDSLWPFSTPQGPSLIPKSKADTLQSITASIQKKASKTPPAIQSTPAGKPTPGPGFSSKGNPEKMEYSPLPEGRIPVLPLRYALSDKTLATLKDKGAAVRTTPSMISDADGFEIVRIRRGFIYVFYPSETKKSKQWEVYRYETAQGDTNSTEGRSDTNEKPIAPTHSFVKYDLKTIKDINWQVNRDIGPTSTVPVRADQPTFSIAYSEFRWPYAFFLAVERDNSFQAKMMTIVETERKKSPYYTSLSELEKISNYFSIEGVNLNAWEEENQVKVGDYLTRHVDADKLIDVNELRYTKNYPEQINSIWLSEKYQNKGKIVVFKDTVGEHLDINAYLELQSELLEKYVDERKYPISTGKVIESILKEQEKATSELSGRRTQRNLKKNEREYGFFERHAMNLDEELHPDFKELFGEIIAGVDGQNNLLDEVISNAHLYMERYDGWYTLVDEIESLIGAGYSKEDQELVSYNSINLTRVFYGLNNTKNGNEYLNALFNKVRPKRQDGTSVLYYEIIESSLSAAGVVKAIKILEGMSGLGTIDTLSYNVLNGVGRFFSFFSYPLSEGFKYGNDKFNKIVQFFYKAEPKKIK
ncbi:toxin VasX [Neptunomonas phycophila]|uniref:toxin VasX n=3 Tax=Oceanospirillaceae TaxID=135620 RepID=UPI003514262A